MFCFSTLFKAIYIFSAHFYPTKMFSTQSLCEVRADQKTPISLVGTLGTKKELLMLQSV